MGAIERIAVLLMREQKIRLAERAKEEALAVVAKSRKPIAEMEAAHSMRNAA